MSYSGGNANVPNQGQSNFVNLAITGEPIDLFEYGNSFTARGFSSGSPIETSINGLSPMLEAMSFGQFRVKNPLTYMSGHNGVSSTYLLANFSTYVTPSFANFDWLLMWGACVNDFTNSISASTSLANIQGIFALCSAAGKVLFLGTPYYTRSGSFAPTTTQGETMAAANRLIGNWARDTPGVVYFDYWNDVVAATQTGAASYGNLQDSDGLHPATLGVQYCAQRALSAAQQFMGGVPKTMAQLDFYDATNNPGGNILSTLGSGATAFEGTSGTISSGTSGQAPTYWQTGRSSGSDTIVFTKIAGVSGYGSTGCDQVSIGVSSAAANCASVLQSFPACPAGLIGQQIEFLLLMTMPSLTTGISDVLFGIYPNYEYGSAWGLRSDLLSAAYWQPGTYLIRTPPYTVPTGTTTLQIQIINNFLAGCNSAVTYSKPMLRQVSQ